MALDLPHGHAPGVEGDDLVIEAGPAGLVLGDQQRLEGAVAVAGNFDGQFAKLALEGLPALAVAGIASGVGHGLVPGVAQMLGHFGIERLLDQELGQLLQEAILADQVFGFLVVGQQAGQQGFRYVVFLGAHCVSGQGDSFLPKIRLHKIQDRPFGSHSILPLLISKVPSLDGLPPSMVLISISRSLWATTLVCSFALTSWAILLLLFLVMLRWAVGATTTNRC